MTRNSLPKTRPRPQRGFGIIEIMIALALGVIIMLGVTQVATNNSSTRYELDRAGRQMENAVFALREIEADLTNAGYWGEMGAQVEGFFPPVCPTTACDRFVDPTEWNNSASTACDLNRALRYPVQGGSATPLTPTFPCVTVVATSPANTITPKLATDYLAIRRANSCALGSAGCELAASNFHLQVHACFAPGVISAPKPGIDYVIAATDDTPDPTIFRYKERAAICSAADPAPLYRFLNRIYYISDDDQLMRAELVWNAGAGAHQYQQTELVEGVELLRFEYGLDSTGNDGQVDEYTNDPNIPDPTAWLNVAMVRVSLVVRNADASPGFTDDKVYTIGTNEVGEPITYCVSQTPPLCTVEFPAIYKTHRRQLYSRTVSLRNVAGRREGGS